MKVLPVLFVMALFIGFSGLSQGLQTHSSIIGPCWVVEVQDGDSITVRTADEEMIRVRYVGIDAPERDGDFGEEALVRNAELVEGEEVWLEVEVADGGYLSDRDGRVLAYLFLDPDRSKLVQEFLVSEGLALIDVRNVVDRDLYPEAFSIRYSARLIEAQIEAARSRRGLWEDRVPEGDGLIIAAIEFWGEIETVYLVNAGAEEVDLAADWILMDEAGHARWENGEESRNLLRFKGAFGPECSLPPRGTLLIRTGPDIPEGERNKRTACGSERVTYNWSGYRVWNTEGDTAFLYGPGGQLCSIYRYPWQERGP